MRMKGFSKLPKRDCQSVALPTRDFRNKKRDKMMLMWWCLCDHFLNKKRKDNAVFLQEIQMLITIIMHICYASVAASKPLRRKSARVKASAVARPSYRNQQDGHAQKTSFPISRLWPWRFCHWVERCNEGRASPLWALLWVLHMSSGTTGRGSRRCHRRPCPHRTLVGCEVC